MSQNKQTENQVPKIQLSVLRGGCHCERVTFEVSVDLPVTIQTCNCSICRKTGFVHLIVPQSRFKLLKGQNDLTDYQFNTKTAHHYFCKHCGIKSFYIPRSNPDGYSVNVNCIEDFDISQAIIENFDGDNWEANAESLSHLSKA